VGFVKGRTPRSPFWMVAAGGSLVAMLSATAATAQTRLEARYRVTLAGLQIGNGGWTVDLSGNRYSMEASGQTSGLVSMFAGGSAAASVRGAVNGSRLIPSDFNLNIKSRRNLDQIRMGLAGGAVKNLSVDPPPKPSEDREPLTDAHKRGVLDPISAGLIPFSSPNGVGPEVCKRTFAVFDGRQRFDLALSFKRMEKVKAEQGYAGPAVVCAVQYTPIGGFYHGRSGTKFLRESRDIEVWYAPMAGTPFVAAYRINIPTLLGTAVLQATRFETANSDRADRAGAQSR
jgi:hypothetical protein